MNFILDTRHEELICFVTAWSCAGCWCKVYRLVCVFFLYTVSEVAIFFFHYEDDKKGKIPIIFYFHFELYFFTNIVQVRENLEMFFTVWPNDEGVINVSEPHGWL